MRVLLDTNVLVRAVKRGGGPARELLDICLIAPNVLCLSPVLLEELSRVLRYPRLLQQHQLTDEGMSEYLQNLESSAFVVPVADLKIVPVAIDPDDDAVVATAIAASAEVICTRDRHLNSAAVRSHCDRHGIQLMDDIELLRRLRTPKEHSN